MSGYDKGLGEQMREVIEQAWTNMGDVNDLEAVVREVVHKIGGQIMKTWVEQLESRYASDEQACCHCEGRATYKGKRSAVVHTVFGTIDYKRHYYLCRTCHQGHYPLDQALGWRANAMSCELERLAGMIGVLMPFAQGQVVLDELLQVSLSDHSLAKASQAYGQEVAQVEDEWIAASQDSETLDKQAPRSMRLYGSIDGGRVHTRAEAGEEQAWRELKIGAWYEAKGEPPTHPDKDWQIRAQNITYYADIATAQDFGDLFWATGVQRHAQRARELIIIADGARWIWDLVDYHFPDAIQIVDWFHACEYLAPVAKQAFSDPAKRYEWVEKAKTLLWNGQLDDLIDLCSQHTDDTRDSDSAQQAVTYFQNNRQRMDYPTYRAQGYQIGSGTIESGVKQIAQQRMKVAGARWNVASARWVAKARAAFLSNRWQTLAQRRKSRLRAA